MSDLAPCPRCGDTRVVTDLVRLANTSATPNEFVATLVARRASKALLPGTSTEFWTYNSMVPGPLVDVSEEDTVRIRTN
mgnify:CR=1 FL=1